MSCIELKYEFLNKAQLDKTADMLRVFYGGQELKDEHFLYQHGIKDGYSINVMIRTKK